MRAQGEQRHRYKGLGVMAGFRGHRYKGLGMMAGFRGRGLRVLFYKVRGRGARRWGAAVLCNAGMYCPWYCPNVLPMCNAHM